MTLLHSKHVIDGLSKVAKNQMRLTMDTYNVYSNIPKDKALEALQQKLNQSGNLSEYQIKDILEVKERP